MKPQPQCVTHTQAVGDGGTSTLRLLIFLLSLPLTVSAADVWLAWMDPFHVFLSFPGMLYSFLLPPANHSFLHTPSVIEDIYLSHSPTTRTLSHTEVRGSLQLTTDSGEGGEIMLPLVYSLSVSFSFHRSGPFASFFPALIIDGLSSAAELETRAIDWPPNRHGFLLKVVKNLPWLIAKHFLEVSRSGGWMKR